MYALPHTEDRALAVPAARPLDFKTLSFEAGGPFVWEPSGGAARYEIVVKVDPAEEVAREVIDAEHVVLNSDGNVEYKLANKDAIRQPGRMRWDVVAFHATGIPASVGSRRAGFHHSCELLGRRRRDHLGNLGFWYARTCA